MDILELGIAGVGGITVICYLVAQICKATALDNKWLPSICGVSGAILGYVAMELLPGYPGTDPITAVAIGIVSGFAATGVNQAVKQLTK
jgi:hypothetical protein